MNDHPRALRTNSAALETETSTANRGEPAVSFYVRPLVAPDSGPEQRPASVWSQNDYVDSISILVTGADRMVLAEFAVDLSGRPTVEGDASVPSHRLIPKVVRWMRLTDIKVDTLPLTPVGRRLLVFRPSALWDAYRAKAGGQLVVDSLHVTVHVADGPEFENGLALLWD